MKCNGTLRKQCNEEATIKAVVDIDHELVAICFCKKHFNNMKAYAIRNGINVSNYNDNLEFWNKVRERQNKE